MRRTLLFLLLLWPSSAWAQAPDETVIVGNDISAAELAKLKARHATEAEIIAAAESKTRDLKIDPGSYRLVGVKANVSLPVLFRETDGAVVSRIGIKAGERWTGWLVKPGEQGPSLVEIEPADFQRWILIGKKQGATSVLVVENGEPGKTPPRVLAQLNITVGRLPPVPPVPPGPGPEPPGPNPPGPAPIPTQGLRVLFFVETADLSKLPSTQSALLRAAEVREYLNAKCAKLNGQPEYRIFDEHTSMTGESDLWKAAMNRANNGDGPSKEGRATTLPWLLISNGQTGYEGPMPKTKDELLNLLKKHGGQ